MFIVTFFSLERSKRSKSPKGKTTPSSVLKKRLELGRDEEFPSAHSRELLAIEGTSLYISFVRACLRYTYRERLCVRVFRFINMVGTAHAHGHSHDYDEHHRQQRRPVEEEITTAMMKATVEKKMSEPARADDDDDDDGIQYYYCERTGKKLHSHDGMRPHSHEFIPSAGSFLNRRRAQYKKRDFKERCFTVGIGGPVGTGKTALMLQLCKYFTDETYGFTNELGDDEDAGDRNRGKNPNICAVTNDIFTKEDGEFLAKHEALPKDRIRAVETGGCPHAAIREDIGANLSEVESLTELFNPDFCLLESGGDNLAANFSRELADFIIYVIDVCGGDKIPRKGGPGVTQADLLVINKKELADAVGASIEVMTRDADKQREGGPVIVAAVKKTEGVKEIADSILCAYNDAMAASHSH